MILSLNYIKYVIVTISNSTGRPYVYEGELMQHCLELDVLRTCVIALSQLLGAIQMQDAGVDVNVNDSSRTLDDAVKINVLPWIEEVKK